MKTIESISRLLVLITVAIVMSWGIMLAQDGASQVSYKPTAAPLTNVHNALASPVGDATGPVVTGPVTVVADSAYNAFPGIANLTTGTLLTVYSKGTSHASDKHTLAGNFSTTNGKTWGTQVSIYTDATYSIFNPQIKVLADKTCLVTFYKSVVGGDPVDMYSLKSTTSACTAWGSPVRITTNQSQGAAPAIQLANGNIQVYTYRFSGAAEQVYQSTDNAASWSFLSTILDNTYNASGSEPSAVLDTTGPTATCTNCVAGTINVTIRDMATNAPGTVNTQTASTGSCNGFCVTWASGQVFNTAWGPQTQISINSTPFIIQKVYSSTLMSLTTDPGIHTGYSYNVTIGYSATTYSNDSGLTWATPTYSAFPAESVAPLVQTPDGCYLTTFRGFSAVVNGLPGNTQYQMGSMKNCDGNLALASWSRQNMTGFNAGASTWFLYSGMTTMLNGMVGVVYSTQVSSSRADLFFTYMGSNEFAPLETVQANGIHNTGISVMEQPQTSAQTRTTTVTTTTYNDAEVGDLYVENITNFTKSNPYKSWQFKETEYMSLRYVAGNVRFCVGLTTPCNGTSWPFSVINTGGFGSQSAYIGGTATGIAFKGSNSNGTGAWVGSMPNSGSDVEAYFSTYGNSTNAGARLAATTNGGIKLGTTSTTDPGAGNFLIGLGNMYETLHGSNATAGMSTLSGGTVTVSTTAIGALASAGGAGYFIKLTLQTCSTCGTLSVGTVTDATSFVINSTNAGDASRVYWEIGYLN